VILRVLTARVPNQNIGEFNELLRAQLSELREQPGLVYAKLARRLDDDQTEEVILVEEWRTTADLFAWTGGRLNKPRLLRGTEELVQRLVITHYEALDVSPEDLQQRVLGTAPGTASTWGLGSSPDDDAREADATDETEALPSGDGTLSGLEPSDDVRPATGVVRS
jgi:heme-degrading monooxygenase HmoA